MLNAILENKARVNAPADHDASRCLEDTLTSAVFERLGYLEPALAWSILLEAAEGLPPYRFATLRSLSFWPSWEPALGDGKRVEPDMFIQLGLGDPEIRVDVIVEAKRDAYADQSERQWLRQVRAYLKARKDDTLGEVGSELYVLAVGGLRRNQGGRARELSETFAQALSRHPNELGDLKVSVATASWRDVLDAVVSREAAGSEQTGRILSDIRRSLEFGGFVRRKSFEELTVSADWMFRRNWSLGK